MRGVLGLTSAIRHEGAFLGDNIVVCKGVLVVFLGGDTGCRCVLVILGGNAIWASFPVVLLTGSTVWNAIGEDLVGSDNRRGTDSPDHLEHGRG